MKEEAEKVIQTKLNWKRGIWRKTFKFSIDPEKLKMLHEFVKSRNVSVSKFLNILIDTNTEFIQWRKEHEECSESESHK